MSLTTMSIVHISTQNGHRPSYRDLFARLLDMEPSTGSIRGRRFWKLIMARNVLFATIDDDYAGFIAVALLRSFLCRHTTGLFLRPSQCFMTERPIVYPMKRRVFRWLGRLPRLHLFSIIPHHIRPEFREVTHDWIDDPQLWDLWENGRPVLPDTELSRSVEAARGERSVTIYIGFGNRIKGFPEFAAKAEAEQKTTLSVMAGRVAPEYSGLAERLREMGAIVADRYVTDDEILSLYKVADRAWCKYEQNYDQASGVFGRAVQLSVIPIVRKGSIIAEVLMQINKSIEAQSPSCGEFRHTGSSGKELESAKKAAFFNGLRCENIKKLKSTLDHKTIKRNKKKE